MWIRIQDKEALVYTNNFYIMKTRGEEKYEISYFDGDSFVKLGFYKSKERAIEVLDEIQERISPKFNYEGNNEEVDVFIKTQMLNSMIAVYQMPEE